MSDISRPGILAAKAVAEYAAFYGNNESMVKVRRLVDSGIAEALACLDHERVMEMTLELLTRPE